MESYVELKEYPGYFIAHSPARLRRIKSGIYLDCKQTPNSKQDSYWSVTLKTTQGNYVKRFMHRLLMQTFVPNPKNKAHVNHIDGDKANNALSNLEWATPKENAQHARDTNLSSADWCKKPVHQYFLCGKYIASYKEGALAQQSTGVPKQNISKVARGIRIHAGYFQWSYKLQSKMPPVRHKYIRGYLYQGILYKTLYMLGKKLQIKNAKRASLKQVLQVTGSELKMEYYG